jgi:hypothetical protein
LPTASILVACLFEQENLRKVFGRAGKVGKDKIAVNELCLGIDRGECFGLLGERILLPWPLPARFPWQLTPLRRCGLRAVCVQVPTAPARPPRSASSAASSTR